METIITCKHVDISGCGPTCECHCDSCKMRYEEAWAKRSAEEHLCIKCGVPEELTPESLLKEKDTHFFEPCNDCAERFSACMKLAKLCENCHAYNEDGSQRPGGLGCKNCRRDESDRCTCESCQP